jgi:DNA invertase Pin-like site-specific DNA recombinase
MCSQECLQFLLGPPLISVEALTELRVLLDVWQTSSGCLSRKEETDETIGHTSAADESVASRRTNYNRRSRRPTEGTGSGWWNCSSAQRREASKSGQTERTMNNPKLTPERLLQTAIVYVRQSTPTQVTHHLESQRRQYGLEDRARELGFQRIIVIDEDLGRTGSGLVDRPGFQRLVAEVCAGEVGAVFCIEASGLARNGRDWHHLIELCGMVSAVVVDLDGIYDPNLINDRLLLGLKGTMSEFEATLIRQRSIEAIHQKARRGELRIPVPSGFCWTSSGKIEKHSDQRVQQAIQLVFDKMTELGSMRRVLIWFRQENVCLPVFPPHAGEPQTVWKLPFYQNIQAILTNPVYAGAYAFGKTETKTKVVDGRARRSSGHSRSRSE